MRIPCLSFGRSARAQAVGGDHRLPSGDSLLPRRWNDKPGIAVEGGDGKVRANDRLHGGGCHGLLGRRSRHWVDHLPDPPGNHLADVPVRCLDLDDDRWGARKGAGGSKRSRRPATVDGVTLPRAAACTGTEAARPSLTGLATSARGRVTSQVAAVVPRCQGYSPGTSSSSCNRLTSVLRLTLSRRAASLTFPPHSLSTRARNHRSNIAWISLSEPVLTNSSN